MIHPALSNMKPIRLLGFSNGNKTYQKAKGAIDREWQRIKPLSDTEIKECINRGHWIGGVIPEGNIGIDIDKKETGKDVYEGLLKAGYSFIGIETPNGYQFIFKDTGRVKNQNSKRLTLGGIAVDYRLAGKGYFVLPTENTEGRRVIHTTERELDPMPLFFLPVRGFKETDTETGRIHEGSRNTTLISHASKVREWNIAHNLKLTPEEKRQALSEINEVFCSPPLPQTDIDRIFQSAESYSVISKVSELSGIGGGQTDTPDFKPFSVLKKGSELGQLNITIEWAVDRLLPRQSITLLHGKGGIGKTWLSLIMADAIDRGIQFMGLNTASMPVVFIDFENSLPVLVDRIKKIGIENVLFWHNSNEILKPPKLDSGEWSLYQQLPEGSLIIFDTLRASQGQDENDSRHMAFILSRLKELRDKGFTILLLHHAPKSNDRTYKGSTAILDLADHVLSLYKVKKSNPEGGEIEDDDDQNCLYRLGTKDKTRYEPFHIFMAFDKAQGFIKALDPDEEDLQSIYEILQGKGTLNQKQIFEILKDELDIKSKGKAISLLRKGEGKGYWTSHKIKNAVFYETVQVSNPICGQTDTSVKDPFEVSRIEWTDTISDTVQSLDNSQVSKCPEGIQTLRTDDLESIIDEAEIIQ